jgi:hypothetical protein
MPLERESVVYFDFEVKRVNFFGVDTRLIFVLVALLTLDHLLQGEEVAAIETVHIIIAEDMFLFL